MDASKPPLPLLIFGWLSIITIPTVFFIFGWRDLELNCHRSAAKVAPTCQISESFAMGLYTRQITAEQITAVNYQHRQAGQVGNARGGSSSTTTSTVVLATSSGEVPISKISSNVDAEAKRELIIKVQEFLDTPDSLLFHHQASMHSIFGYLGALGVAGLGFLAFAVLWYHLRKRLGWLKKSESQ